MASLEHLIAAVGLSLLLYGLMRTVPVYPLYWDIVIAGAIFALTLISPVAGYFAAVTAATYPLYSVSLYLTVAFLAVAIIGQHVFINNLGATLLTFASPLLGSVYLAWGIPLLGGLWWGPAGGALMGAFAALWGLLVAGMVGLSPDWVNLYGVLPILKYLPERFSEAGSLEVFELLFLPLAPDSTYLLYCVLQIGSWALVGWAVGMLSEKDWALYRRPRSNILIVLIGAVMLALIQIWISAWLRTPISGYDPQLALGLTTLFSALAVMVVEIVEDFFEHPLPIPAGSRAIPFEIPAALVIEKPVSDGEPPASPEITKTQKQQKNDDPDDLIMLELD